MPRSMIEVHESGQHREYPRDRCPLCKELRGELMGVTQSHGRYIHPGCDRWHSTRRDAQRCEEANA